MRKYDSYKKSTFEWMGEIPSHWILTKNRFGFQKYSNGKNESDDTPVLSLTTKGVKVKTNLSFGKSSESYIGHQLVEKGDIVFTPRDFDQTPILSDVSNYFGCISNLYIVDKTKEGVLNHFVNYYWYGLKYSVNYFKNFSHGMRYSFNRFQFDEIPLILPPLTEQQQIVSYLDTKNSLIDSLIEKTQRKIELLKEKRTSLINEVVTKGLNPNVEMKDSGVEWIGEIPSHWIRNKLNRITERIGDGLHSTPKYVDSSEYYFINGNNLVNGEIKIFDSTKCVSEDEFNKHFIQLNSKTLLLSINGTIGNLSFYNGEKVILGKSSCYIKLNENINHHFVFYVLKSESTSKYFTFELTGTTIFNLSLNSIRNTPIVVPPENEQQQIVSYLDDQTQKIDSSIQSEEKKVELLKEYRQSLISEVVTGKMDVRLN